MTREDATLKLELTKSILNENQIDFDAWIERMIQDLEEIFGVHSEFLVRFLKMTTQLYKEFDHATTADKENIVLRNFTSRSKNMLESCLNAIKLQPGNTINIRNEIETLRLENEYQRVEVDEKSDLLKKKSEELNKVQHEYKKYIVVLEHELNQLRQHPLAPPEPLPGQKFRKSFVSIASNAWTLIITPALSAIGGAYSIGKDIGGASLEGENNLLDQQLRQLQDSVSIYKVKADVYRMKISGGKSLPFRVVDDSTSMMRDSLDSTNKLSWEQ